AVHRRIGGIVRRRGRDVLAREALHAGPRLDQRGVDGEVLVGSKPRSRACVTMRSKKACATSPASSLSRFLVKTVGFQMGSSISSPSSTVGSHQFVFAHAVSRKGVMPSTRSNAFVYASAVCRLRSREE